MAIHSVVMERDFGANKEGDVVQCDEELAKSLVASGVAREATEEDLNGGDAPEDAAVTEEDAPDVQEEVAVATRAKEDVARKEAAEEIRKQVVQTTSRPALSAKQIPQGRHITGSDELRTGGFKSLGDAATSFIASRKGDSAAQKKFARYGDMRRKATGMSISGSHQGSDLVPQEWAAELWRLSFAGVPDLLSMCTKYEMQNQVENIPSWVQTSATSAITAAVVSEASQMSATVGATQNVQLSLVKFATLVNVSDELLRFNAYNLENVIKAVVPERIRYYVNDGIINGTNSQVNLVGNAAAVTVLRALNNRISYADVTKMDAALWESFADDAIWLCNRSSLPELYSLAFPNTSGTYPAFAPGVFGSENLLGPAPKGMLLGHPVYTVENCPAFTAKGGLILYSPKSIAAGYTGLIADRTPYLYFDYAQDSFRFLFYVDTVNPLTSAYTRQDNSTASNIIVLSATSSS